MVSLVPHHTIAWRSLVGMQILDFIFLTFLPDFWGEDWMRNTKSIKFQCCLSLGFDFDVLVY